MKLAAVLIPLLMSAPIALPAQPPDSAEVVVLVHGMGRTKASMVPLAISLERAGFRVINFQYSSYGPSVAEIAATLRQRIDRELAKRPASRINFVGHSLGSIVIRYMLAHHRPATPTGRFVMLAPPNRGSAKADRMLRYFGWLLAPMAELRTTGSTAAKLPPPSGVDVLIIAGQYDEKVKVAETCLPGVKAHLVLPAGHTFIMMHSDVIKTTRRYLRSGVVLATHPARPADCPANSASRSAAAPW